MVSRTGMLALVLLLGAGGLITAAPQVTSFARSQQHQQDPQASGPPTDIAATLAFEEDFSGMTLSPERWQFTFAGPQESNPSIAKRNLWANRERQVYFDPDYLGLGIDPFRMEQGVLTIEARPLTPAAQALIRQDIASAPGNLEQTSLPLVEYSSGLISTRGRFEHQYGYFEIRARWSGGKGLWPAFWLLPAGGGWPPEIDILEAHGDKSDTSFHSLHSRHVPSQTIVAHPRISDGEFHTYGALWTPEQIDFFVDGVLTASMPTRDDMHGPMFLVVNLAVGGGWPGMPDADTIFPATYEIDHVRVWQIATQ